VTIGQPHHTSHVLQLLLLLVNECLADAPYLSRAMLLHLLLPALTSVSTTIVLQHNLPCCPPLVQPERQLPVLHLLPPLLTTTCVTVHLCT
jgi:hypothetical protein